MSQEAAKGESGMAAQKLLESVRILTWNINGSARALDPLRKLARSLDVVTLQEVTSSQSTAIEERLADLGFGPLVYSGHPHARTKRYGNIIASRWPVRRMAIGPTDPVLPWPQLVAHAVVETPAGPLHVLTAHVPNGVANGWAKIDTLRALAGWITRLRRHPLILTGDFNEPQFALQDGRIVTWGEERGRDGRYRCWDTWTFHGRTGTGKEWDEAVRWFFEMPDTSGLRNAYWEIAGHGARTRTHVSRGEPRWFDHVFVSDHFQVQECAYRHALRTRRYSDHSPLVARLGYVPGSKGSNPSQRARRGPDRR